MSEVKNITDPALPEYNGTDTARIAVFNEDTETLNWARPGGGGSGGTKKLVYGQIMLATENSTPETQADVRGGITRDYQYCLNDPGDPSSGLRAEFQKVKVDIYEGQTKIGEGLTFATFAAMYTWLQANASFSGGEYDYNVRAVFYDEIDFSIEPLSKLYGKNMWYSVLKGKASGHGTYKNGGASDGQSDIRNTNWSDVGSWVEDVFADTNTIPAYVYPGASVLPVFTTPSSFKTAMRGLHSLTTQLSERTNKAHINDTTEVITSSGIYAYNVDFGDSVFYSRNITNESEWHLLGNTLELNQAILHLDYSVIRVYKLYNGSEFQFYIKPVGIDTLYVDYFDQTKYELVKLTVGRDRYMDITDITTSTSDGHEGRNILQIAKDKWMDHNEARNTGRNTLKMAKKYKFFLRDLTTGRISLPTKRGIEFVPGGAHTPLDIRVE